MPSQKPFQKLLSSEMSRREFISFIGVALLGVLGITGMIRGLRGIASSQINQGYGSSPYGGGSESAPSRKR